MARARLMDRPEDLKKLGINPDRAEEWEDGRRDGNGPGVNEVWYFDAILDDGGKIMAAFRPKSPQKMTETGDSPNLNIMYTSPDGQTFQDFMYTDPDVSETREGTCHIQYGPHSAIGNFKHYDVHVEPVNGVGADLHYEALVKPFRQGGTGIIALGDDDEYHYTDLSVPKNRVTGTITAGGQTYEVTGLGYHDHQWMNIHPMQAWHHWLWGHLYTDQYTVVIYDFVASAQFDFRPVPFFGVIDNTTGETVFTTDGSFTRATELATQEKSGKDFPKVSDYHFNNADGTSAQFRIEWDQEIETRDMYGSADDTTRARFDAMGIQPVYMRYYAHGNLTLNRNGQAHTSSGDMIYEYNYIGKPDPRAHV